jgi:hypothetical protein
MVMNTKIKELWDAAAKDTNDNNPSWQAQEEFIERLVKQTVGECVLAILATDTRSLVYTTFDRDLVASALSRAVDSVRDHFKD